MQCKFWKFQKDWLKAPNINCCLSPEHQMLIVAFSGETHFPETPKLQTLIVAFLGEHWKHQMLIVALSWRDPLSRSTNTTQCSFAMVDCFLFFTFGCHPSLHWLLFLFFLELEWCANATFSFQKYFYCFQNTPWQLMGWCNTMCHSRCLPSLWPFICLPTMVIDCFSSWPENHLSLVGCFFAAKTKSFSAAKPNPTAHPGKMCQTPLHALQKCVAWTWQNVQCCCRMRFSVAGHTMLWHNSHQQTSCQGTFISPLQPFFAKQTKHNALAPCQGMTLNATTNATAIIMPPLTNATRWQHPCHQIRWNQRWHHLIGTHPSIVITSNRYGPCK